MKGAVVVMQTTIQPELAADREKLLVSIFPSIPFLAGFDMLSFYIIDKRIKVKIKQNLKVCKGKTVKNIMI